MVIVPCNITPHGHHSHCKMAYCHTDTLITANMAYWYIGIFAYRHSDVMSPCHMIIHA
jgi:hypothetical protein